MARSRGVTGLKRESSDDCQKTRKGDTVGLYIDVTWRGIVRSIRGQRRLEKFGRRQSTTENGGRRR